MRVILLTLLLWASIASAIDTPSLNWTPRSDWINVRTHAPVAIGNGIVDDTAALQAAFNVATVGKTIYIPAGTYKITATLAMTNSTGSAVIGNGSATRIVWAGTNGGTMFVSNGNPYSKYNGISWDGSGTASVGFDHAAQSTFETEIQHVNEAYRNFTGYGIRIGNNQIQASAEILYENCLFVNCTNGIGMLAFNDYDNTIDHCQFENCSVGVNCDHGNFYARNSHFQNSGVADLSYNPEHGSSIRRCTSTGSAQFALGLGTIGPITIQDCQVSGWTSNQGAVAPGGSHSSSTLIFDCVFTGGVGFPVVPRGSQNSVIISQNTPTATNVLVSPTTSSTLYVVPNGSKNGSLFSANQTFLNQMVSVPGTTFDAKVNFGAVGNGIADDTAAIQATINAAKNASNGAMAYIPTGSYKITSTLLVTGTNYYVGGSGFKTCLNWSGSAGIPFMVVSNVQGVVLSDAGIGTHDCVVGNNGDDIIVTGTLPVTLKLDGVRVFGKYDFSPATHGLHIVSLPSGSFVDASAIEGNIIITNCSSASVLFRVSYEGTATIRGPASTSNLAGFLTRLTTLSDPALQVFDNQSLVMSDFYVEQSYKAATFSGNTNGPLGNVTIQSPKAQLTSTNLPFFDITGYAGRISYGQVQFYNQLTNTIFTSTSAPFLQFIMWGNFWYNSTNIFNLSPAGSPTLMANSGFPSGPSDLGVNATSLAGMASALDDLRDLGRLDLRTFGTTIWAPDCSMVGVQAAIAYSQPGDTILIPSGTCDYTTTVTVSNQVQVVATNGASIRDSIINTGDSSSSACFSLVQGNNPALFTRLSGFTFVTGSRATKLFDSGNVHISGGYGSLFRIDQNVFNAANNIGIGGGDSFGVIDHNVFDNKGAFTQPMKLQHNSYGGSSSGYGAWALPSWTNSYHEDASAIYIENNWFTNSSGIPGIGIDGFGGARWVTRHNIFDRMINGGHGTETTAQFAGCRLKDAYNDLYIEHGDSEAGHYRSGSGSWLSNTIVNSTSGFVVRNYRAAFGGFYKYANATNAWDLNDAIIYGAGIASAGGTLAMTDGTQSWTVNQWVGFTIRNVPSGRCSIITANTANTISYLPSTDTPASDTTFTPGQAYQFRKVITILDEVGRGMGSLRNNTVPAWPNEVVDPVYQWDNTLNGGTPVMNNGGYYTSVVGQELINGQNLNWLPFTYPHPLVTGTNAPGIGPTITRQPASTNIYSTQTALFTIQATGATSYSWFTNGVAAGTNGPALAVGPAPVAWSGMSVVCVVGNASGTATSATATLTVLPDPVITSQPANTTVGVGAVASFSVTATGQTTLQYLWKKNGSSIGGATASTYNTPATVAGDNNSQFAVVVTDTAGSLQSANATLTVTNIVGPPDPVITAQPQSTNIFNNQTASFSVTATGGSTIHYQWKTNGVNTGTDASTLALGTCPIAWSGMTIVVIVSNLGVDSPVTSSTATLTISADPVIVTQPHSAIAQAGNTASFSVSATGQTTLSYQWSRNGSTLAGATASTYGTPILNMSNNGDSYFCDVTDTADTLRSATATLTVTPLPSNIARVNTLRVNLTKAGP